MSIYDDLSNSAYMENDKFIKQLQLHAQPNPMDDRSLNSSQHNMMYNNHYSDSARVNQDDLNTSALRNSGAAFKFDDNRTPQHIGGIYHNEAPLDNISQLNHMMDLSSNTRPDYLEAIGNNYQQVKADLFNGGALQRQGPIQNDENIYGRNFMIGGMNQQNSNQPPQYYQNQQQKRETFNHEKQNILPEVQTSQGLYERPQLQTGHFQPIIDQQKIKESISFSQMQTNNQELEKLLMQLKVAPQAQNAAQNYGGYNANNLMPASVHSSHQSLNQSNLYNNQHNYGGANQYNFNQDNSLLALAQMPVSQNEQYGRNNNNNMAHMGNYDQSSINQGYYRGDSGEFKSQSQFNYPPQLATPASAQNNQGVFAQNKILTQQNNYQQQVPQQRPVPIYKANNSNYNQQIYDNPFDDQENRDFNIFQKPQQRNEKMQDQSLSEIRKIELQNQPMAKPQRTVQDTNDQYNKEITQQEQKKKEIMSNFDEIPIKDLNKAEGYQTQKGDEEEQEQDESQLTIVQRVNHSKWKTRMTAYKEISDIFYKEYTNQHLKKKPSDQDINANLNDGSGESQNIFETYSPYLQDMITDQNLVAQQEGLSCLYSYMRFAPDIKVQVHALSQPMFEKVQLNKQTFRDILLKIWLCILRRTQAPLQVILSKLKHKTPKIQTFAMEIIGEAMQNNILIDEPTLKQVFKAMTDCIYSSNKEIKDSSLILLKEIYRHCEDNAQAFVKNLKKLRPVQAKEIKDMLSEIEKTSKSHQAMLFQTSSSTNLPVNENYSPRQQKQKSQKNEDNGDSEVQSTTTGTSNFQVGAESDLCLLVPDNFNEIPYLTQINIKKKGMETFNQELERLVAKRVPVANKDYSQIYNVVVHMLEDSNALVFMEAIKCVEFLSILLGKSIKGQKLKQFVQLLTEKVSVYQQYYKQIQQYKETKSNVTVAVNKTINQIVKSQGIPVAQLIDYLINTLANNNKNPRAKQLIMEKVDQIIQEEPIKEDDLVQVFKTLKDKLVTIIQKDTNASVRDASVQLLTTFKMILPDTQIITEAVNSLPKYRVAEINKKAQERAVTFKATLLNKQPSEQKIQSQQTQLKKNESSSEKDFSYQGRQISGQYQIGIADIILSVKNMKNGQLGDATEQKHRWEDQIEKLGGEGIKEGKPVIVSCVHWLFKNYGNHLNLQQNQESLDGLMVLLKTIYCIDRSIERQADKKSLELTQSIDIVLIASQWSRHPRQVEALLNVVVSAAGNINEFMKYFQASFQMVSCSNNYDKAKVFRFTFKWLSNKLDNLLQKGLQFSELEQFQKIGQNVIDNETDDEESDQLVQILSNFNNELYEKKKQMDYLEESSIQHAEDQDEDKEDVSQIFQGARKDADHLEKQPNSGAKLNKIIPKTKGQEIVEAIDNNFEQGLILIKQLASTPELADFKTKEMIFHKLISIVESQNKNSQQQQYQQTYSLKALLWIKEELMGLEDCFKFADQVMLSYAKIEQEGKDTSVEQYLLNNWTKELSIRDLVDRIAAASQVKQGEYFLPLFNWLINQKLNSAVQQANWQIEDFRKVALFLGKCIGEDEIQGFFQTCVDKFGANKIRDFMEIQLMHSSSVCHSFIDWFSDKFQKKQVQLPKQQQQALKLPEIGKRSQVQEQSYMQDQELQNALNINNNNNIDDSLQSSERGKNNSGLQNLQERRERRKNSIQKKQDKTQEEPANKYEDIISRIELQLQQQLPQKQEEQSFKEHLNFQKTQSSNYYATNEKSKRYSHYDESEEQRTLEEDDEIINATAQKLKQSEIQESRYKEDIERLEHERQRIEDERENLLRMKNKQTDEWKDKYDHMRVEHADVISNLQQVNKCYLTQVNENEELKGQLKMMNQQHRNLMQKFEQIETKLEEQKQNESRKVQEISPKMVKKSIQIVKEEHIAKLQQAFTQENGQVAKFQSEGEQAVKKIQELLLNAEKNVVEEIGQPLYFLYQKMRTANDRFAMIQGLHQSIQNSDVLYALSYDTYKALLNFLLKVFAAEKAKLDRESISVSQSMNRGQGLQNDVTAESQKVVSILLNSKEFTTSLVILFQILKETMPEDLSLELTEEQRQFLIVLMRCVGRITKALHSESPDLVRAFDVLIELQKIFLKHPPEMLREDLPSLEDLDYVYRGLKDVSDKLIELHPEKIVSFLKFVQDKPPNAFTRYMQQMMNSKYASYNNYTEEDDANSEGDEEY